MMGTTITYVIKFRLDETLPPGLSDKGQGCAQSDTDVCHSEPEQHAGEEFHLSLAKVLATNIIRVAFFNPSQGYPDLVGREINANKVYDVITTDCRRQHQRKKD
jgi:hypothetical protein